MLLPSELQLGVPSYCRTETANRERVYEFINTQQKVKLLERRGGSEGYAVTGDEGECLREH